MASGECAHVLVLARGSRRKKALVEVRQSHTAKTRQSIISTPDVSEKLFRECVLFLL